MSDAPTQRFEAQPPPSSKGDAPKSRLPLVLGIIGGVLLIAVIVLLVLLLGRNNSSTNAASTDSPTPTDTTSSAPVPTPTVTVTVTAAPAAGGGTAPAKPNGDNVLITNYTISPAHPDCSSGHADLDIAWKSVNGGTAFFGVNTTDAQEGGMGWNLPASGTQNDFPAGYNPFEYTCGNASTSYTITVVGNGSKQSLTLTVHRK